MDVTNSLPYKVRLAQPLDWPLPISYQDLLTLVVRLYQLLAFLRSRFQQVGPSYEVLRHHVTLDLRDKDGKRAYYIKKKRVRLLQDNVKTVDDYAWGDGKQMAHYQVTPGILGPGSTVGPRHITPVLLPGVRTKGDVVDLNIEREILNGFQNETEWLEAEVSHPTKRLRLQVIFPSDKLCKWARVHEHRSGRIVVLGRRHFSYLPKGDGKVTCEIRMPRLYETYTLQWAW